MALRRDPIPSPNYSGRGGARARLIVIHTAEGSRTYASLGAYFGDPSAEVSSQVGIDDTPGAVGEYVRRDYASWTQASFNGVATSAELCGFAAWSAAEWDAHGTMLDNTAAWIAEEAAHFGIPIVRLTAAQAQGSGVGVCSHQDLGSAGGGHSDPGPAFPWDRVLAQASGGAPPPVPAPTPPPAAGGGGAPPWPGTLLVNFTTGHGTATWQARMAERGWTIAVDDMYGDDSEAVCRDFQAEKGLGVDGIVGPDTWAAAWTAPVT